MEDREKLRAFCSHFTPKNASDPPTEPFFPKIPCQVCKALTCVIDREYAIFYCTNCGDKGRLAVGG